MAVNPFDQASRYAAKLDPVGFLCWLLSEGAAVLRFRGWLDARTLPFPGDPERTCDTVAWLGDDDPEVSWAVPVEFSLEPVGTMFGRLLVYLGQLWLELRPTDERGARYQVGAVVVNLTGRGQSSRDLRLRQTGIRTCLGVRELNLADANAAATLDGIAAGTLSRCVLPWIALMRGGADPGIMVRWQELARTEPDPQRQADYGGLALVFAEAAGRRPAWKEALQEWNMIQSQQVLEWMAQGEAKGEARGKAEGKAESILRALEMRFAQEPPADLSAIVRATTDLDRLSRWFDAAMTASSLEGFREMVARSPSGNGESGQSA